MVVNLNDEGHVVTAIACNARTRPDRR